jgi:phosphotransferase system  glucose/maltose/N-acetylglucosamine-specific IIC component
LIRLGFMDPDPRVPVFRRKMLKNIGPESLTSAFKHWQNLAVGAILMAFSAYITFKSPDVITNTTTQLQGWAMLVIAGYIFSAALFLGLSTLSEHSPLTQTLPGVVDNFKIFVVAGIFYALGYFLLNIETNALPTSQSLSQALSFIIGGAFFLFAVVIAVTASFREPKIKNIQEPKKLS